MSKPEKMVQKKKGVAVTPVETVEESPIEKKPLGNRKAKPVANAASGKSRPGKSPPPKKVSEEITFEKTLQMDPRFPNTNQTKHCFQSYVDYFRCQRILGPDHEPCDYFKRAFTILCPKDWVSKWDEQREEGTFPGKL